MFGIGGGELIFILFVMLMLFGADKIPDIARTLGQGMAQLKNATNDLKSEIQKGAEEIGIDKKMLDDVTGGINSEIDKVKNNLLGDTPQQFAKVKEDILGDTSEQLAKVKEDIEDLDGPIKRQM
ncbi:MAG: twin-arginine translocase TatA/TatE family subunit [Bacteroidota bacterium]